MLVFDKEDTLINVISGVKFTKITTGWLFWNDKNSSNTSKICE